MTEELETPEETYRGFAIEFEEHWDHGGKPFTVTWTDGQLVYYPLPKPTYFKTREDALATAKELIGLQYQAEAAGACVHFHGRIPPRLSPRRIP
jgi:hypothetical protein